MKIRAIKRAPTLNVAQLQAHLYTPRRRQRGAVALEYLVLAAAMIAIFGALSDGSLETLITSAFENLFSNAAETATAE